MSKRVIAVLILCPLLLQSCSTSKISTTMIPGRELTRTPLGKREIDNKIVMDEVEPGTIRLHRLIAEADFTKVESQALREDKYEKKNLNCSGAWAEYSFMLITTLGIPLVFDLVSGFHLFKSMCKEEAPSYSTKTEETDKTIIKETYDQVTVVHRDLPVTDKPVVAEINGTRIELAPSADGMVSFPAGRLDEFRKSTGDTTITYQYDDSKITTTFKAVPPAKIDLAATDGAKAKGDEPPDHRVINRGNEALQANYSSSKTGRLNSDTTEAKGEASRDSSDQMARIENRSAAVGKEQLDAGALARKVNILGNEALRANDSSAKANRSANDAAEAKSAGPRINSELMAKLADLNAERPDAGVDTVAHKIDNPVGDAPNDQNPVAVTKKIGIGCTQEQGAKKSDLVAMLDETVGKVGKNSPSYSADPLIQGVMERELNINLDIVFDANQAIVKRKYRKTLKSIGKVLKKYPSIWGVIEGHTDNLGSAEANKKLSRRRAAAIARYLVKTCGISAGRLQVRGYGMAYPIAPNDTAKGRAKNRRIEVKFINPGA